MSTPGTVISAQSQGQRVRIAWNDPDVGKAIEMGFKRLLVERSQDSGLSYEEITKPSERFVLEPTKVDYSYIDRDGNASYLYRTRYVSEDGAVLGDPSEAIAGAGAILARILTVAQLKQRYMFGVNLTNDAGEPLPEESYEHYILTAIAWLESTLDIKIIPTTILLEPHDYFREDYPEFCIIQLDNYPVISVEEFSVQYPSGSTIVTFPPEWIRVDPDHGILRIVPTAGTLSNVQLGQGGSFLPAIYGGMNHLPDLFKVSYTAGFENVPRNLIDIIGMFASFGPFNIFGDLIIGAGISSLSTSMDGLSQSIGTTLSPMYGGYGSRITQYWRQIKDQIPNLRRYYKGIRLVSV